MRNIFLMISSGPHDDRYLQGAAQRRRKLAVGGASAAGASGTHGYAHTRIWSRVAAKESLRQEGKTFPSTAANTAWSFDWHIRGFSLWHSSVLHVQILDVGNATEAAMKVVLRYAREISPYASKVRQ